MTWLKRLIIQTLLLVVFHSIASGQLRNAVWCFGDSAGIDFSDLSNVHPITSAMDGRGTCVSIADSTGQLLLYAYSYGNGAVGSSGNVRNKYHRLIQNGDSIVGLDWYHEMLLIPSPANSNQYYLFSTVVTSIGMTFGFYFNLVDMSANNDSGAVIQKNVLIEPFTGVDAIGAVKHGNGRDWWIVTRDCDTYNDKLHIYLVDRTGIHIQPEQHIGSPTNNNAGNMTFNAIGDRMLLTTYRGLIETIDFDRCSGQFSNANIIQFEDIGNPRLYWGSEFSSDGTKLYLIKNDTTSFLYQFDLTAPDIFASRVLIDSFPCPPYYAGGALKRAPDNKIYLSNAWYDGFNNPYPYADSVYNLYNMNLGVINYPDSMGLACQFSPYSFHLDGKRTYLGLPNNPDYDLGPLAGSLCDTINTVVEQVGFSSPLLNLSYQSAWQRVIVNASKLEGTKAKIYLMDISGRILFVDEGNVVFGYLTKNISMEKFTAGVYLVTIVTEREKVSGNLIKE